MLEYSIWFTICYKMKAGCKSAYDKWFYYLLNIAILQKKFLHKLVATRGQEHAFKTPRAASFFFNYSLWPAFL